MELLEDIAWGEYDAAWKNLKNKDVREALIQALREDFEHAHGDKLTLFFSLVGVHDYYAQEMMVMGSKIHRITGRESGDSAEIVARLTCTDKAVYKRENSHPAPKGSWQDPSKYGLSRCKGCERELTKAASDIFAPSYKGDFFNTSPEAVQMAWREMLDGSLDEALNDPKADTGDTLIQAAKDFALLMVQTYGNQIFLQGAYQAPDSWANERARDLYNQCVQQKGADFEILDELPAHYAESLVELAWDSAQNGALNTMKLYRPTIIAGKQVQNNIFVTFFGQQARDEALNDVLQGLRTGKVSHYRSAVLKTKP
jgi:hypothetical protein